MVKRKTLRDELTGKAVNSSKTKTGRHALPTKSGSCLPALRYTRISNRHIPAFESAEHNGAENRIGVFLFPVRSASPLLVRFLFYPRLSPFVPLGGLVFPAPSLVSGRGFQRGGLQSRPFVPRGYGGRVASPCFGWGLRGGAFTLKAPPPCPIMEMSPCGSRELCGARHRRALPCYPKS